MLKSLGARKPKGLNKIAKIASSIMFDEDWHLNGSLKPYNSFYPATFYIGVQSVSIYLCFDNFPIGFWNCPDSVGIFYFILQLGYFLS